MLKIRRGLNQCLDVKLKNYEEAKKAKRAKEANFLHFLPFLLPNNFTLSPSARLLRATKARRVSIARGADSGATA
jgi:hypothetical protein